MIDELNKYRRNDGYIDLEKIINIKKIDRTTYGSREKQWFQIGKQRVLFKANQKDYEDIREIINEEMSNILDIKSAKYDLAIFENKKGVITKDCLLDGDEIILMLFWQLKKESGKIENTLYSLYQSLLYNNIPHSVINEIIDQEIKSHILDLFTSQYDRNIENSATIKRKNEILIFPRFDSANSFLNVHKIQKVAKVIHQLNEDHVFEKYKGNQSKRRLYSKKIGKSAMEELILFVYGYNILNIDSCFLKLCQKQKDFIEEILTLNLNDIYEKLKLYQIKLNTNYKQLFQFVLDYKKKEFHQTMEKVNLKK